MVTFRLRLEKKGKFEVRDYRYENGIIDYVRELSGTKPLTEPEFITAERKGRDREDKPEYKVKLSAAFCFSKDASVLGILPQLLLAGKRRRPGQGRQKRLRLRHRCLHKEDRQVSEE